MFRFSVFIPRLSYKIDDLNHHLLIDDASIADSGQYSFQAEDCQSTTLLQVQGKLLAEENASRNASYFPLSNGIKGQIFCCNTFIIMTHIDKI